MVIREQLYAIRQFFDELAHRFCFRRQLIKEVFHEYYNNFNPPPFEIVQITLRLFSDQLPFLS